MATTINATRSYEDYEKEQIDKAMAQVNQQAAAYKQNSDQTLSQIGAAIDKSANTAAGVYQKRIDGADAVYKKQYAANAVQEAFNRQQIKESMANSGITDSGYNRTMQTALTLNRSRQDAAVTADKRDYVQEMQNAIDAVWADAASQKATQEITAQQNYQTFYDNLYANAMSGARENAVNLYNADKEAAAKQAELDFEYEKWDTGLTLDQEKYEYEAGIDTASKRESYALKMMEQGYSEDAAWAAAYTQYPSGNEEEDAYYKLYAAGYKGGYSDQEADLYAQNSGDKGVVAEQRIKALDIDLNDISTWNHGKDTWLQSNEDSKEKASKNNETEWWSGNISGIVKAAKKNVKGSYSDLDLYTQTYLLGKAVANTVIGATTKTNAKTVLTALADELPAEAFKVAEKLIKDKTGIGATMK